MEAYVNEVVAAAQNFKIKGKAFNDTSYFSLGPSNRGCAGRSRRPQPRAGCVVGPGRGSRRVQASPSHAQLISIRRCRVRATAARPARRG